MQIFGIHILAVMTIAGALGGLLFGYRNRGLVFPYRLSEQKHSIDLGFIADCAFGAAGAIVVFIIIPLDLQDGGDTAAHLAHQIRILAVAFIGGYGGPALIDIALARTLKDVTKRTEEIAEQTNAVETKLDLHENQQSLDMKAFELVDIHLSDTMQPVSAHDLIDTIKVASPAALENIYQRAKETRHEAWRQKLEDKESHQLTERTIPIFKGLLASHYGVNRHRYHAQLGYALKDQEEPDWGNARDCLGNAMTLLEESRRPMSPFYKFNWALCAIELHNLQGATRSTSGEMRQAIVEALEAGSRFWKLKNAIFKCEKVKDWLSRNHVTYEDIGIKKGANLALAAQIAT